MTSLLEFTAVEDSTCVPTDGFKLLYRQDHTLYSVRFKQSKLTVHSLIYETSTIIVGIVCYDGCEVIAKFLKPQTPTNELIFRIPILKEIDYLRMIESSGVDNISLFLTAVDTTTYCLLFRDIGETLSSFSDNLLHIKKSPESKKTFCRVVCDIINIHEILHTNSKLQFNHGDVRPENIIVLPNGDVRLIDWVTAMKIGHFTCQFMEHHHICPMLDKRYSIF
ncbi:hypothetical protein HK098_007851 [Nowakowskiella sp. JEL0407]|nr:hypothetical protein HK098_007851 [Nowakowskiella sp. JEL0407]